MTNYVFCTLALGQKYFDSACKFAEDLNKISEGHSVLIVTDCKYDEVKNTTFIKFDESEVKYINNQFNYNLKYIPIQISSKMKNEVIIFFDADWEINEGYTEEKLNHFITTFMKSNLDLIYERPHKIGDGKKNISDCFWRHKIEPYGLLKTNKYDEGHVVNEQFLIFKNNDKLNRFIDEWKKRNLFGINNNIWAFAEGLEIGMSAIDANMVMDYRKMFELRNFFKFVANSGVTHIRF
jgi:hypothetical protein